MGTSSGGLIALDEDGKLYEANYHHPSDEIKEADGIRQIRAGTGCGAVQFKDGTWRAWGAEPLATAMNQKLEALGPLKDLSMGSRFFLAIK